MVTKAILSLVTGNKRVAGKLRGHKQAREAAEAAIAEARSVHSAAKSKVAALLAHADQSTTHTVKVLLEHVQKMAGEMEAKTSRTIDMLVQQLEQEITAAATSTAATAEITTCTVVEGMRRDVQAQT